jgi:hypothetical protein
MLNNVNQPIDMNNIKDKNNQSISNSKLNTSKNNEEHRLKNQLMNLKPIKITNDEESSNKINKKHLPKNVNEYRHIIDSMPSSHSDVEWVLELRAYNNKRNFESLKQSSGSHPDIYKKSFEDYRSKVIKDLRDKSENTLRLKGNSREFEHVINKRIGMAANPTQLGFDSTLRSFDDGKSTLQTAAWKTIAIPKGKTLLSTYLPPMIKISKENLDRMQNLINRPYEKVVEVN